MAIRKYTAEELRALIRKNGGFSDVESEGTSDTDLLNYINEEILQLYAEIATAHEEFFIVTERMSTVANQAKYRIPFRAMFGKIRCLQGADSSGNPFLLEQISRENVPFYGSTATSYPSNYYIENNHIVLHPSVSSTDGSLDISYLFKPGELVASTACRQIDTVNLVSGAITVASAVPSTWTTNLKYDVHDQYTGATIKSWQLTASAVSGTDMTFTATDIDGSIAGRFPVEIGDWVCEEETAALPGLPREFHPLIAQAVICRLNESKDPQVYQQQREELSRMIGRAHRVIAARVESPGETISLANSTFFGR